MVSVNARGVDWRKRLDGLVPARIKDRHVAVIGCGSVGSFIATELVRAGVYNILLVDPDIVEWPNLTRTVYGHRDIGRNKAEALADVLRSIYPDIAVEQHVTTVQKMAAEFKAIFSDIDLVVAAVDDPPANGMIDRYCYAIDIPVVFVGLYKGAKGGEIIVTVPGDTPCFHCTTGGVRRATEGTGVESTTRQRDYGTNRLVAEVALGSDIHFVCCAAVKLILSMLTGNDDNLPLSRFLRKQLAEGCNFVMLGMEPDYFIFPSTHAQAIGQYTFQSVWAKTARIDECDVCGLEVNRADPFS